MRTLSILFVSVVLAFGAHADDTHIPTDSFSRLNQLPKVEEAQKWKSWDWDTDTWTGFKGRPWIKSGAEGCKLIRHKRFVVNYDTTLLNPRWTAHIETRECALNIKRRPSSNPLWARPGFSPDPFLIKLFEKLKLPYVRDEDFVNSGYARGHMTPNAAMKGYDQDSQRESFYLSNVIPQLQKHNGGIWSGLEADSLKWAEAFGTVYVITGPVFLDPKHPAKFSKGKGGNQIPVPDKVFKILISEKDDHLIAAGFLIDHREGLKKQDLFKYQVPIDDIEKASGIDFMPLMGEPNAIETAVDPVWKDALFQ